MLMADNALCVHTSRPVRYLKYNNKDSYTLNISESMDVCDPKI